MDFDRLSQLFGSNSSFSLLRSRKAPLIIGFLFQEFKTKNNYRLPYFDLSKRLVDYMEFLKDMPEQNEIEDTALRARQYIESWTSRGFVIKAPDDKTGEDYIELTTKTEKVINWIEDAINEQRFIGTESRFKDIFHKLEEVIELSTEDPQKRLEKLEIEKKELERKIEEIRQTGKVTIMEKHQVEENFIEISRMAKSLLADFKDVEKNFQNIGRKIYEKQTELIYSKGALLGIALDAWAELKKEEQGRSFYAFWDFLQSDSQKELLKQLIEQLYQLLDQHQIAYGEDQFLKYLKRHLYNFGARVLQSNDKLAEKLTRVLAEKNLLERKRILGLIQEIRQFAFKTIENPPSESNFMELPVFEAEIKLPLNKRMVLGAEEDLLISSSGQFEAEETPDFTALFNQFYVSKTELENRIRVLLKDKTSISLKEILELYPVEKGLTEIVTYYSIASQHSRHQILPDEEEKLVIDSTKNRFIKSPKIVFYK